LALALADGPQPGPADAITAAICIAPVVAGVALAASDLGRQAVRGIIAFAAGDQSRGVVRVNNSLEGAADHINRISQRGPGDPGDEDPNFIRDMLNHAQKHLNNAQKYIGRVRGKTRERLQEQIDDLQSWVDAARGG
jgi:hypothetical protein